MEGFHAQIAQIVVAKCQDSLVKFVFVKIVSAKYTTLIEGLHFAFKTFVYMHFRNVHFCIFLYFGHVGLYLVPKINHAHLTGHDKSDTATIFMVYGLIFR